MLNVGSTLPSSRSRTTQKRERQLSTSICLPLLLNCEHEVTNCLRLLPACLHHHSAWYTLELWTQTHTLFFFQVKNIVTVLRKAANTLCLLYTCLGKWFFSNTNMCLTVPDFTLILGQEKCPCLGFSRMSVALHSLRSSAAYAVNITSPNLAWAFLLNHLFLLFCFCALTQNIVSV